jgi:hypothetical protein
MNTIRYLNKTVVDDNNIMWTMDLDRGDNTVTITSDYALAGSCAVLSQYSIDNATGQDIPDGIVDSAMDMIDLDDDALRGRVTPEDAERINDIIEQVGKSKQVRA